jgi:hypothetical protein
MEHAKPRVLVMGHSHAFTLETGLKALDPEALGYEVSVLGLWEPELAVAGHTGPFGRIEKIDPPVLLDKVKALAPDIVLLCLQGNTHNVFGVYQAGHGKSTLPRLRSKVAKEHRAWLDLLVPALKCRFAVVPAPPPFEDIEGLAARLGEDHEEVAALPGKPAPAAERLRMWEAQCETIAATSAPFGIPVIELPADVFSESGFLREDCQSPTDLAHGNAKYGERVMAHALKVLPGLWMAPPQQHPYQGLPDYRYWQQAVSDAAPSEVDPVVQVPFKVTPEQRVATAGSCFARHISRHLRSRGFNFIQLEKPDPAGEAQQVDEDFSARFGNIYTSRQLLQLFDRAAGTFVPDESVWQMPDGRYCDPFRPRIEPGGCASPEEVVQATQRHLRAVHEMFRTLDVFVFTLGLTECWSSSADGAVYPLPPGVAGGRFDAGKYSFHNFGVSDVLGDLRQFMDRLLSLNPAARVILTVSPVPLVATGEDRHVLVSTTYSKSVLRVAADELARAYPNVMYFPAYEVITGQHVGNQYYAADRREVDPRGVRRVMALFERHVMHGAEGGAETTEADAREDEDFERGLQRAQDYFDAQCEEELLRRR